MYNPPRSSPPPSAPPRGRTGARPVPLAERPAEAITPATGLGVQATPMVGPPDWRTRQTVEAMRTVALDALRDPSVVERAAGIVQHVDGRDAPGKIRALRAWLAKHVRFLPDPLIDGDVIRTPALLLKQFERSGFMQGDCDDVATLAATLGHAVGIPARFVTLGFFGPTQPFRHVFAELDDGRGTWHEMDVTENERTRRGLQPTRRETYDVLAPSRVGLGTLLGVAQLVYLAAKVIQSVGALTEGLDDV